MLRIGQRVDSAIARVLLVVGILFIGHTSSNCANAQMPNRASVVRFDPQVWSQSGNSVGCGMSAFGLADSQYVNVTIIFARNKFGIVSIGKFSTGRVKLLTPPSYTTTSVSHATVKWADQSVSTEGGAFDDGVFVGGLKENQARALINAWLQGMPFTVSLQVAKQPLDTIFDMSGQVSDDTRVRYAECLSDFLSNAAYVGK